MTTITSELPTTLAWYNEIRDDLKLVEQKMLDISDMGHTALDAAVQSIIQAGGKRLRPALAILTGRLFKASMQGIYSIAASVELLHTATLIHDDLIDGAAERRGVATLHSRIPLGVTVLTGDFLFAQAAALAAQANSLGVVQLFAETLVKICKGEILQAQTRWKVPTPEIYEERIYGKTAALFEASAVAAAMLGESSDADIRRMGYFGRALGLAFQIVDDALDFVATTEQLGKPTGHDLRQGIFNLPVMFYVQEGYIEPAQLVRHIEENEGVDEIIAHIRKTGMVERSLEVARQHIAQANAMLAGARDGLYADFLNNLSDYALARAH